MNLWHDIPVGEDAPNEVNVIIEIPKGSHNKYEIDKETGVMALDRANFSDAPYPVEYGFVPQTLWDDGDALDVLVLATWPLPTGLLVACRPIAIMEMEDEGEQDHKVIMVPVKDKRWEETNDLNDINKHTIKEIKHFFETYKILKGKGPVVVPGFKGKKDATEAVERSIKLYQEKFGK